MLYKPGGSGFAFVLSCENTPSLECEFRVRVTGSS